MQNNNPDASQTRQPSGRFGPKKIDAVGAPELNSSLPNVAIDTVVQPPTEPKIRDLFQRRIFASDARHCPYVTVTVLEDVNERYRCVSLAFYGTEDYWPEVRKRLARRLREGKRDGLPLAENLGDDHADEIEHSYGMGGHPMGDEEFALLVHEYDCNAVLMELERLPNGRHYVPNVIKYARSSPSEATRVGILDYNYPTIVCAERGARCELVRELSVETGEVHPTEKRRREITKLKQQVSGRNIPALFIEGMNARGLNGSNVHRGWSTLISEIEKDHFNGRMLPTAEARVKLLDYCAEEVRKKEKARR